MDLFYEEVNETADSTPIYLIHTVPLDHNYMLYNLKTIGELHIVALDLPGHGQSEDISGDDYSFGDMATAIDLLRIKLGHQKIIVLGHGVGGIVAMEYILSFGEHVEKLILVNTAPNQKYREVMAWNIREKYSKVTIQALEQYKGQEDDKSLRVRFTQSLACYFDPVNHEVAKSLMDNANRIGTEAYVHISRNLLTKFDYRAKLREIQQPVLIVACNRDVWPETSSQLIRNDIIHAKFIEFGCGHFPMVEIPDKFWLGISQFTST